ncbi:MAG TPA: 4-(cytidine 5'-diphospho)-2-C-methyl-D-erythritol kinase, partial [Segetibacter sp.]
IPLDLSMYKIVLVNPGIHISTKEAFSKLKPQRTEKTVEQLITQPIATWKNEVKNDFEEPVFKLYPATEQIKNDLYTAGALYASMTGTGSTVYGIFPPNTNVALSFPDSYRVISLP